MRMLYSRFALENLTFRVLLVSKTYEGFGICWTGRLGLYDQFRSRIFFKMNACASPGRYTTLVDMCWQVEDAFLNVLFYRVEQLWDPPPQPVWEHLLEIVFHANETHIYVVTRIQYVCVLYCEWTWFVEQYIMGVLLINNSTLVFNRGSVHRRLKTILPSSDCCRDAYGRQEGWSRSSE